VKVLAPAFVAVLLSGTGCTSSAAPPNPTAPSNTPTLNVTGTWVGSGTDAQGPETFSWTLTQTNGQISGRVALEPKDPADGTCGSCHKQKTGTFSGTLSGTALTLTMDFPAGGKDLTPLCGITMTASTTDVAAGRIASPYTGTTTCEGAIADGTLVMVR